jgi:hypothetical protein
LGPPGRDAWNIPFPSVVPYAVLSRVQRPALRTKEVCMLFAVATVLLSLVQAGPLNVQGTWDGTVTSQKEDGSTKEEAALLILEQKDGTITGSVGGNENDQMPLTSGAIEGKKVTLTAKAEDGREFRVELTLDNDQLTGTVASGERRAQVAAHRRK